MCNNQLQLMLMYLGPKFLIFISHKFVIEKNPFFYTHNSFSHMYFWRIFFYL